MAKPTTYDYYEMAFEGFCKQLLPGKDPRSVSVADVESEIQRLQAIVSLREEVAGKPESEMTPFELQDKAAQELEMAIQNAMESGVIDDMEERHEMHPLVFHTFCKTLHTFRLATIKAIEKEEKRAKKTTKKGRGK